MTDFLCSKTGKALYNKNTRLWCNDPSYIADYIKSLGYDGICFRSTVNKAGVNYAIFDSKTFECIDVKLVHVNSVEYDVADANLL